MPRSKIELDPGQVSDPKRFGEVKARCLDLMENTGLLRTDGSGRPSTRRRAKGKFLKMVHSSLIYEHLWLIEELERVTGQKAQMPVAALPEDEEAEDEEQEEGEAP